MKKLIKATFKAIAFVFYNDAYAVAHEESFRSKK